MRTDEELNYKWMDIDLIWYAVLTDEISSRSTNKKEN